MNNATPAAADLFVLITLSPSGGLKFWAPLPLKAAQSVAQSKRDRGYQTQIVPA